jgi:hypothetical protein
MWHGHARPDCRYYNAVDVAFQASVSSLCLFASRFYELGYTAHLLYHADVTRTVVLNWLEAMSCCRKASNHCNLMVLGGQLFLDAM